MKKKAIIISIKGYILTNKEKLLIKNEKPWGLILFTRNVKSIHQVKNLIKNIRKITKDKKFPILIDEEGGRVSRLINITKHTSSQKLFGDLFESSPNLATSLYKNYIKSLCFLLKEIGININTVPVLDVLKKNTHKVIGDRSFSKKALVVKKLGECCIDNYKKSKVATVAKHIPGHGCASSDSHFRTPIVKDNYSKLKKEDFFPFKNLKSHLAMTAHVIYKSVDKSNVATFSKIIIKNIIRNRLRFKGILISDDISMKALKYDLITSAKKSLAAGCNIVLYCAGNYQDCLKLIKAVPYIDKFTSKKTSELYKFLG